MEKKYTLVHMSKKKAYNLSPEDGWEDICENNYGMCMWNNQTGELVWIPFEGTKAKFSKLNTQVQN